MPTDADVARRFLMRALESVDSAISERERFESMGVQYDEVPRG